MSDLDRTVIITGATKGLGRELSLAFASDGYTVIGLYNSDVKAASAIKTEFAARGHRGIFIRQDIVASNEWPKFDEALAGRKDTDITLIANASAQFTPGPFHLMSTGDLSALLSVNVVGTANVLKRLLPTMVKNRAGTVVSVLSSVIEARAKGFAGYRAAKSALLALSQAAAEEYRDRGIRFLCVSPGFMDTPLTREWSDLLKKIHDWA